MQVLGGWPPDIRVHAGALLYMYCICTTCVSAWGVAVCEIILSFARVCLVGVGFGFVRSALLLVVGMCAVLSFKALPGLSSM